MYTHDLAILHYFSCTGELDPKNNSFLLLLVRTVLTPPTIGSNEAPGVYQSSMFMILTR